MKRMFITTALAIGGLGVALLGSVPTQAAPSSQPEAAPGCRHAPPTEKEPVLLAAATDDSDIQGNRLAEDVSRAVITGDKLDETGRTTSGLPFGLAQGVVGIVGNATTGFIVVVDPEEESLTAVVDRLKSAVADRFEPHVEVVASCSRSDDIAAAWRAVSAANWGDLMNDGAGVMIYLDAETEQVVVEGEDVSGLAPRFATIAASGLVRFEDGASTSRLDRFEDDPPYKGGLRIKHVRPTDVVVCTGGFTVIRNGSGNEAMTTAGHCGPNGWRWTNGPGEATVGDAVARSNYPDYDQELLVGRDYAHRIFVDGPGDADPNGIRAVTGASDPSVGQLVCTSGFVTDARCGWEVQRLDAQFCDEAGCTTFLLRANKAPVHNHPTGGDSGGPIYTKPGDNAARIRGMIVAGGTGSGGNIVVLGERYDSIAGHLNVHIATTAP